VEWIKNFKSKQENFPEIIIIYREGLTDKQIKTQSKAEIDALNNAIKRARSKYPNYDPEVIYILVSKRSSKRLYRPERTHGSGKFAPIIMNNPIPGTMVFESISSPEVYDFHLMAQNINQGTATLTNYQVAYDASKIPQ
jgi:aubergine-like protein